MCLQYWIFFDVGIGQGQKLWCGCRLHPSHTLPICLTFGPGEDTGILWISSTPFLSSDSCQFQFVWCLPRRICEFGSHCSPSSLLSSLAVPFTTVCLCTIVIYLQFVIDKFYSVQKNFYRYKAATESAHICIEPYQIVSFVPFGNAGVIARSDLTAPLQPPPAAFSSVRCRVGVLVVGYMVLTDAVVVPGWEVSPGPPWSAIVSLVPCRPTKWSSSSLRKLGEDRLVSFMWCLNP